MNGGTTKPGGSELLADLRLWLGVFQRQIRASSLLAFRVHVPMVYLDYKNRKQRYLGFSSKRLA